MTSQPAAQRVIRFGLFEFDLAADELRKQGRKREELQQAVWPADTFVEFDQGLNTAVKKIRQALGDSADNPRFIEAIPRKGYRFIAPVSGTARMSPMAPQSHPQMSNANVTASGFNCRRLPIIFG